MRPHAAQKMILFSGSSMIPVAPARNLAIILEVAAMNHREKKLGHNAAKDLMERHDANIDQGWGGFV